jgi:predicted metal-dependent enzyme (double-stranded beta helix superfamily)
MNAYEQYLDHLKSELDILLDTHRKNTFTKNSPEELCDYLVNKIEHLVRHPELIPEEYTQGRDNELLCYLLLKGKGYSLFTIVWGPGYKGKPHNHRVPGAIGILEGEETEQRFTFDKKRHRLMPNGAPVVHKQGDIATVFPDPDNTSIDDMDWHCISNKGTGKSVSLHLYAADFMTFPRLRYTDGDFVTYTSHIENP